MVTRRAVRPLEDAVGARERRAGIAFDDDVVGLQVGIRTRRPRPGGARVRRVILVHERRPLGDRRLGVKDRRQRLVDDLDRRRRRFGLLARLGRDRRNVVSDQSHPVERQHRPVSEHRAEAHLADVPTAQHRVHSRHCARRLGVEPHDLRVRVR